ncbi:MAG TPA: LuxR C-terminal-related transcriptional regulator [Streptosporangiaceae bacterium]|nr:LuxR C-terminal-related transcriptional regulator [Streptosporangiaceae bacterium]
MFGALMDAPIVTYRPPGTVASFPPLWLLEASSKVETLTERQRDVMELLGQGLANSEIARELSCSERTVKQHLSTIFARLNVYSRLQAGLIAYHSKLRTIESDRFGCLGQDS